MPWSVKAEQLLRQQYAAVGAAARAGCPRRPGCSARRRRAGSTWPAGCADRGPAAGAALFSAAYRRYCWPTAGWTGCGWPRSSCWPPNGTLLPAGARLAPGPGRPARRCRTRADPAHPPPAGGHHRPGLGGRRGGLVARSDRGRRRGHGGQPLANLVRGAGRLTQPGIKVRGPEYLRIIYGPDYALPGNLDRLQDRNLAGSGHWRCGVRAGHRGAGPAAAGSRCGGCTRRCSACWPWSRSGSTHGCERSGVNPAGPAGHRTATSAAARSAGRCTARSRSRSGSACERPGHARTRTALAAAAVS